MKRVNIKKIGFICLLFILMYLSSSSNITTVNASSVGKGSNIYNEDQSTNPQEPAEKEEAGWAESIFSGIIGSLGDGIDGWLSENHADLDSIIFGRVGYVKTNYFSFDMSVGNPYGLIGSWFYSIVRSIILPILVFVVLYYFLAAAWDTSGKGRAKFKSNLQRYALVICLLFAAPAILDLIVYIKDLLLYLIQKGIKSSTELFAGKVGIIDTYKANLDKYETVFDAFLYVAAVCVSLLFAFSYIATALSTTLAYAFFPIIAAMSFSDSKLINTWLKTMIGNITIPIIDSLLLYIPVVATTIGAPNIVVFAMTMMLLPSRAIIRQLCGLGNGGAAEMLGVGAMLAAGRLISSTAKSGKNIVGNLRGKHAANKSDKNNQKMYEELSELGNGASGTTGADKGASAFGSGMSANIDSGRAEVMRKHANVSNFENKDFASILSDKDKANFYKQRKRQTRISMGKDVASAVGGLAGLGAGFSAGAFYGPGSQMTAMSLLGSAGSEAGGLAYSGSVGTVKATGKLGEYLSQKEQFTQATGASGATGHPLSENTKMTMNANSSSASDSQIVMDQSGTHSYTDNIAVATQGQTVISNHAKVSQVENGATQVVDNKLTINKLFQGNDLVKICDTVSSTDYKKRLDSEVTAMIQKNSNLTQVQARANVYQNAIGSEIERIAAERNVKISSAERIRCQSEIYGIMSNFEKRGNRIGKI